MPTEPNSLQLQVVTPEKQVISATATEVQLPGLAGYLGILPGHAPLLTELGIGVLSYAGDSGKQYAAISGGFAEVLPDRVTVLADIAERDDEIETARAAAERDRAQTSLNGHDPDTDWDAENAALKLAEARLQVAGTAGHMSVDSRTQAAATH